MTSIGEYLKRERELRQLSLEELSRTTRIPIKMLRHLEAGRFEELPGEVFVRGYVRAYARSLGVSADDVVARYNQLNNKPTEVSAAPVTAITPPERGRRFGIAIALVILLILFTLALSIVLRPRRYDSSIELSLMRGLHQLYEGPAPGPSRLGRAQPIHPKSSPTACRDQPRFVVPATNRFEG